MFYVLCMLFALWGSDPFPLIIIALSVMCVMRLRHHMHVMRPIPFLLKTVSYKSYALNVYKSRYEVKPFSFNHCSKCYAWYASYSCYTRCNPNTSPPVNYVLGVVRVMPVLRVVRLCPFSRYHRCFYSVLCLMHVMQDMHVMSPNHFLLKTMSYTHQVLNVCKLR